MIDKAIKKEFKDHFKLLGYYLAGTLVIFMMMIYVIGHAAGREVATKEYKQRVFNAEKRAEVSERARIADAKASQIFIDTLLEIEGETYNEE